MTAAAAAVDAGIQKKIHGSVTTTLIIPNKEMNDIMKIVQALEDSNLLLKRITKAIENETKKQKRRIFRNVVRYFRSYFFRKYVNRKRNAHGNKERKGVLRACYGNKIDF